MRQLLNGHNAPVPQVYRNALVAHLPGQRLAAACLLFHAGAVREGANSYGVAGQVAQAATQASLYRCPATHAEVLESLGATVSASINFDVLRVQIAAPARNLADAVKVAWEGIEHPRRQQEYLTRIRREAVDRSRSNTGSAFGRARSAVLASLFAGGRHRVEAAGTPESNARVTTQDVADYHDRWLSESPQILAAGDLEAMDLDCLLSELPGSEGSTPTPDFPPPQFATARMRVRLVDRPNSTQSTLMVAHSAPEKSAPAHNALTVAATILGGQFSSRLNRQLREVNGFTYGATTILDSFLGGATLVTHVAVRTELTVSALRVVQHEMKSLADDGVTAEEVRNACAFLSGGRAVTFQTPVALISAMTALATHRLPVNYWSVLDAENEDLSKDAVDYAAANYIRAEELAIAIVGDSSRYRPGLVDQGLLDGPGPTTD